MVSVSIRISVAKIQRIFEKSRYFFAYLPYYFDYTKDFLAMSDKYYRFVNVLCFSYTYYF